MPGKRAEMARDEPRAIHIKLKRETTAIGWLLRDSCVPREKKFAKTTEYTRSALRLDSGLHARLHGFSKFTWLLNWIGNLIPFAKTVCNAYILYTSALRQDVSLHASKIGAACRLTLGW